jgi:prevent-host-death family protein
VDYVKVVNMHEAKTTLSQLVEQVERGEEVVLARAGQPVARIVPIAPSGKRQLGAWKGRVRMSDDFDAPLPDTELAAWSGDA